MRIMNAEYFPRLAGVDARIEEMDRQGIDVQAVSLYVGQYHYWAERDLAEKLVRIQNESLAELCATHPDRLVGLGAVALHFPELAAAQMAHAVKELRFSWLHDYRERERRRNISAPVRPVLAEGRRARQPRFHTPAWVRRS